MLNFFGVKGVRGVKGVKAIIISPTNFYNYDNLWIKLF